VADVPVPRVGYWPSNAELIVDVARLGWLRPGWRVLDPTFGRGTWWKLWRPRHLDCHDLRLDGVDFTRLPHPAGYYDAVAFDPPYVATGGRDTSTVPEFQDRYGLYEAPGSPRQLQQLIDRGLAECTRVVRPRGLVLVKCADYVSSGRLWPGVFRTFERAERLGLELVDELVHATEPGMQPLDRTRKDDEPVRQHHARFNSSTLLVFRADRR
jgi:hypothetical protein